MLINLFVMRFIILFFIVWGLTACKKQVGYVIEGEIAGLPDSIEIILMKNYGDAYINIDTVLATGGQFCFKGIPDEVPMKLAVSCTGLPGMCIFRVGDNVTKISGESVFLSAWVAENDLKEQQEENEYILRSLPQLMEIGRLMQQVNRDNDNSVWTKIDSIYEVVCVADFNLLRQSNPGSIVYLEKLQNVVFVWSEKKSLLKKEELVAAYQKLPDDQKNSLPGEFIECALNPATPLQPGDEMPDAILYDLDSNVHRLSDYKGKYMLLEFWRQACAPCLKVRPVLNQLADEYSDSLHVIGINLDQSRIVWELKMEGANPIAYVNLSDGKGQKAGIGAKCCVSGTPAFVLASPEGKVLTQWSGSYDLLEHVFKFLKEKRNLNDVK